MGTLSDRLKALGVRLGTAGEEGSSRRQAYPVEHVIPGSVRDTPLGETYRVDRHYPSGFPHGTLPLHPTQASNAIAGWMGEPRLSEIAPESYIFLDTETTGLAGGTGTFAFLVGVGRFVEGDFLLAQHFLRDPIEEPALLVALEEFLGPCEVLVTFNGKSFDVPLLNTRYITNGWERSILTGPHLDLLHLARRLWRDRLTSHALSHLETHILGLSRTEEDVPGWMIPQMYIDYLRTGDSRPLQAVFYHNAMDVLTMASLLGYMDRVLEKPLNVENDQHVDLVARGRIFEHLGEVEQAILLYQQAVASGLPDELHDEALIRQSIILKRRGEYEEAIALWRVAAERGVINAHVELAKYFEHRAKDYQAALNWTRQALDLIHSPGYPVDERIRWDSSLQYRLARIQRKLG